MSLRGKPSLLLLCACMVTEASGTRALPVQQLAPGLFVHQGVDEEMTPANAGAIANIGFIVGRRCVAVIDTGGSLENGQRLRLAIRQKTSLPVCYVINTHVHPDHVLGNAAFLADKPAFIGHRHLAASMLARREHYRKSMARQIGEAAASVSTMVVPTRAVASELTIDLGGRVLQLRAWPTAHTDADLTVLDQKTGALWLGDLLFERRVPSLDGSLKGWLAAMEILRGLPVRLAIPGHGTPGRDWPGALREQEQYLQALLHEVRQAIADKKTLAETAPGAASGHRDRWLLFDNYHARNVTVAYTELEWEN
nr:quinoprotein relay system zinc metallohydrolase 2 [uncultured Noviherbaspirillum sp.]